MKLKELAVLAKQASYELNILSSAQKNFALLSMADAIDKHSELICVANSIDIKIAMEKGMSEAMLDRLKLDSTRIKAMADGIRDIEKLPDPVGEILSEDIRPNGLNITKKRVPIGVIGIIYEARPNVTSDAASLCFKSGNVTVLKGGSDAIESNKAIAEALREGLRVAGCNENAVTLITSVDRETTLELMKLNEYIDCLIPRGSRNLINAVIKESTVPVIETGSGNCHIYVDKSADIDMALNIIENAKTQRIGVCNACESLVVHYSIINTFLPLLKQRLDKHNVEIRADERARAVIPDFVVATEEDWGMEYLDFIISLKIVDSIDEAIKHINKYNTKHSDSIITADKFNAEKFLNEIDSSCVYVNASTRFTDGSEFGFGAEIGISTQKLHARGPMGLKELTSYKYVINGNGQIR